jgi:hypothetical protein
MTVQPDHELNVLEDDQTVPPRPEEVIADAARDDSGTPAQEIDEGAPTVTAAPTG